MNEDWLLLILVLIILSMIAVLTGRVLRFRKRSMNQHKSHLRKSTTLEKIVVPFIAIIGIVMVLIFGKRSREGPLYEWFMSLIGLY